MVDPQCHWEKVFTRKPSHEVSWYKPHLEISLQLIARAGTPQSAAIIDVGGGKEKRSPCLKALGR